MSIVKDMDMIYDLKMLRPDKDSRLKSLYQKFLGRMDEGQRAAWDKFYGPVIDDFYKQNLSGKELADWKFQRYMRDYMKTVKSLDDNVGRVLDYLEKKGLLDNTLVVYTSDQGVYDTRKEISIMLGWEPECIVVENKLVGGGFGGKEDMIYQGILAIAALKTKRPVKLVFSRNDSMIGSCKRHPVLIHHKIGLRKDGKIQAVEIDLKSDGGAYCFSYKRNSGQISHIGSGTLRNRERQGYLKRLLYKQYAFRGNENVRNLTAHLCNRINDGYLL